VTVAAAAAGETVAPLCHQQQQQISEAEFFFGSVILTNLFAAAFHGQRKQFNVI